MKFVLSIFLFAVTFFIQGCFSGNQNLHRQKFVSDGYSFVQSGNAFSFNGNYTEALASYQLALDVFSKGDYIEGEILSLLRISETYLILNDLIKYQEFYKKLNFLATQSKSNTDNIELLQTKHLFKTDQLDSLILLSQNAISYNINENKNTEFTALKLAYLCLAKLNLKKDYSSNIFQLIDLSKTIKGMFEKRELENPLNYSFISYSIGLLLHKSDKHDDAIKYLEIALEIDRNFENFTGLADDLYLIGRIKKAKSDFNTASYYFSRAEGVYKGVLNIKEAKNCSLFVLLMNFKQNSLDTLLKQKIITGLKEIESDPIRNEISNEIGLK